MGLRGHTLPFKNLNYERFTVQKQSKLEIIETVLRTPVQIKKRTQDKNFIYNRKFSHDKSRQKLYRVDLFRTKQNQTFTDIENLNNKILQIICKIQGIILLIEKNNP